MKAKVIVMPKRSVLDPQGVAVRDAIHHHGVSAVKAARVGKFIELELDGTQTAIRIACWHCASSASTPSMFGTRKLL
jgi:phosphoribosylformylglycinamidine (FGAM) synthase PurS component